MEIKDTDIVFVTTNLYTKWADVSANLVKKYFPDSEHIHIDGRTGWFDVWFKWIDLISFRSEKYFVHIDEDCFLNGKEGVIEAILKMNQDNAVIAGIRDAGFYWRNFSTICVNPFFMVGDLKKVSEASKQYYRNSQCKPEYIKDYIARYPETKESDVIITNFEPYYCFFYNLLDKGYKFSYLASYDDFRFANQEGKLPSTNVRVTPESEDICIHMWYTRQWQSPENIERYQKLEQYINGK